MLVVTKIDCENRVKRLIFSQSINKKGNPEILSRIQENSIAKENRRMKKIVLVLILSLFAPFLKAELLPLNPAESILPKGSKKKWFAKMEGKGHGKISLIRSTLKYVASSYYETNGHGTFVFGRKNLDTDCSGFDQFIFWLNVYEGTTSANITVKINTDKGERNSKTITLNCIRRGVTSWSEIPVNLQGAQKIKSVSVHIEYIKTGKNSLMFTICGLILRNSARFSSYMKYLERFSKLKWTGLLQKENYQPKFKPIYNLCFSNEEFKKYQKKYYRYFIKKQVKHISPEQMISDNMMSFINRQHTYKKAFNAYGRYALMRQTGPALAFKSLVTKDKKSLRMAARYALSMCAMQWMEWPTDKLVGAGAISAFGPSSISESVTLTLDMAGEMLTPKGRDYILKSLMLKGVAPITHSLWARNYVFHMNQGVVFLRGKMTALLAFDKVWPRVGADVLNCKKQIDECMNTLFYPDGSYLESFGYMGYTISCAVLPYNLYANVFNKSLTEVLPKNLKKSGLFAEVCASTSKNSSRIITGSGQVHNWLYLRPTWAAFMAYGAPKSFWVNLYKRIPEADKKNWKRYYYYGLIFDKTDKMVALLPSVKRKNFILLKNSGLACSYRIDRKNNTTKFVLVGDAAKMGKKHCDVGSFTLEYAGDIYAMDMPVFGGIFSEAQYHNMLLALDEKGHFISPYLFSHRSLLRKDKKRNTMCPEASGDEVKFHAKVNSTACLQQQYLKKWQRFIDSPSPNEFTIRDEYTLGEKATGIAFIWNTFKDVSVNGQIITITGEYGSKCIITVPQNCKIELDKFSPAKKILKGMALAVTNKCTRIIIKKLGENGEKDSLTLKVQLVNKI